MTVWLFYIRSDEFDAKPRLYAFTDNKKLAKEFQLQRNPEKIIMSKRTDFTRDEWNDLNSKFPDFRIICGSFYTKSEVYGSRKFVSVLCTAGEEIKVVTTADTIWKLFTKYLFDTRAFKPTYLKALDKLLFHKFYCFYVLKHVQNSDYFYEPYYSNFGPSDSLAFEDFRENSYDYDDLGIFIRFFGDTFSKNKGDL